MSRRPRARAVALLVAVITTVTLLITVATLWRGQPRSVARIQEFGGVIRYAGEPALSFRPEREGWFEQHVRPFIEPVHEVHLAYGFRITPTAPLEPTDDEVTTYLDGLPHLRVLSLKVGQATDRALVHVGGLRKLEKLNLYHPRITYSGVAELRNLCNLSRLQILNGYLGDDSLEVLGHLHELTSLYLNGSNRFTDEGLAHIAALTELEELSLGSDLVSVTDAGLEHIAKLDHLRSLQLYGASITDDGLLRLSELYNLEEIFVGDAVSHEAKTCLAQELLGLEIR